MKIYIEVEDKFDFKPWGGAVATYDELTEEEFSWLLESLEDIHPEGISETELNDILWFETDFIAEYLGYSSWENLEEKHREE